MQPLSDKQILNLQKKMGGERNLSIVIESLGKNEQFQAAWETPIGKEIMAILVAKMVLITEKILDGVDEDKDRAELKAYRTILDNWSARIKELYHGKAELKKNLGEL